MQRCTRCRAQLYDDGAPSCPGCSVRETLTQEVLEATANKAEAFRKFGLPHPDRVQRIKNASNELSIARKEMARAYERLSAYLDRGTVPGDLNAKVKKASA